MPLFARYDYDFTYGFRAFERAYCMSNHWFVRNCDEQFIEAHALAAAAGYDDGTKHSVERLKRCDGDCLRFNAAMLHRVMKAASALRC
jgi:hypothetical protein